jgi:hypothetical protein
MHVYSTLNLRLSALAVSLLLGLLSSGGGLVSSRRS